MLISPIGTNVYKNKSNANIINFKGSPALSPANLQCQKDMLKALELLGNKQLQMIIHNASAPSYPSVDVGTGSLYSRSSRELLIPFLKTYGFSAIQLEPEGMRSGDGSPYTSNSFVYNPMLIDLEDLTKPDNGSLLGREDFQTFVRLNPNKNNKNGDYAYAKDVYDTAMDFVWENYKDKSQNIDSIENPKEKRAVENLSREFFEYKAKNGKTLEPYALYYNVFTPQYDNDYYKNWPQEIQDIYSSGNKKLINKYLKDNKDAVDKFMFVDLLAKKARDKGIKAFNDNDIKTIGDNPVGFSNPEYWAHKNAFLPDYKIGCPPEPGNPQGQAWGSPVLNPDKYFNNDGSLDEAGKLLYDKCYKLASDNKGGIRIDHIFGLIDPFVYKNSPDEPGAGRLFSSPHNPDLARFAIPTNSPDSAYRFGAILRDIVIPACEAAGLSRDKIIGENLGSGIPKHINEAFRQLGLSGMYITQYGDPLKKAHKNDTIMPGTHDTTPLLTHVMRVYSKVDNNGGRYEFNDNLWKLFEKTSAPDRSHNDMQNEYNNYVYDINSPYHDDKKSISGYLQKKYTELFICPNEKIQISFSDLMNMTDRYNKPGFQTGDVVKVTNPLTKEEREMMVDNWTLRLSSDFAKQFDPTYLITAVEEALRAKGRGFESKHRELLNSLENDKRQLSNGSRLNLTA